MKAGAARLGIAVVVVGAVFAAAAGRLVAEGRSELAASDAAWAKGDGVGAAVHARSAARAHVPGAAHMELAYAKLRDIAERSERRGDVESALFAWRAILSAAAGTRPFAAASGETRAAADASVARLSAALTVSRRRSPSGPRATSEEPSLVAEVVPRAGWGALLLGGAALFWGAGLRLTSSAWDSGGRIVPRRVHVAVAMASGGLLAWLVGLLLV